VYSQLTGCIIGGPCASGTTCQSVLGTIVNSCTSADGFVQGIEFLLPGADGHVPQTFEAYDDWEELQSSFCRTLRSEAAYAPTRYNESDASCRPQPTTL
jgi:hypothetical protein